MQELLGSNITTPPASALDAGGPRAAVARLWPGSGQADTLKRELAMLLLEDPGRRLRLAHCHEILAARLPGIWATWSPPPQGAQPGIETLIHAALAQDPACKHIFHLDSSSSPSSGLHPSSTQALPEGTSSQDSSDGSHGAWGSALLRLDWAELLRRGSGGPALPIAAPVPAGAIAAAAAAAISGRSPAPGLSSLASSAPSPSTPTWPQASDARAGSAGQLLAGYRSVGSVGGSMEAALLRCALATWGQYESDDDAYLALAVAVLLIFRPASSGGMQLVQPCSLALPQLLAGLQALATGGDERLRARLTWLDSPRRGSGAGSPDGGTAAEGSSANGGAGAAASRASVVRLQELLCQPPFKGLFKLRDAPTAGGAAASAADGATAGAAAGAARKVEKLVFLCVDKLSPAPLASAAAATPGQPSPSEGAGGRPGTGTAASELPLQVLSWLQLLATGCLLSGAGVSRSGSNATIRASGAATASGGGVLSSAFDGAARSASSHALAPGEGGPGAGAGAGLVAVPGMGGGDLFPHEDSPSPGLPNFLFEYEAPDPLPAQLRSASSTSNQSQTQQAHPSLQGGVQGASASNGNRRLAQQQGRSAVQPPPPPRQLQGNASGGQAGSAAAGQQQQLQQQRSGGGYGSAATGSAAAGPMGGALGSSPPGPLLHNRATVPQLSSSPFSSAPPASSPTGSMGAMPPAPTLFSTSPSMQTHVPREVASCWGAPTLSHTSHTLSSAHSLGAGIGAGAGGGGGLGLAHTSSSPLVPALSTSSQHRLSSTGSDTFRAAAFAQAGQVGQGSVPSSTATTPSGMAPAGSFDRPSANGLNLNSNLGSSFKGSGAVLPQAYDLAGLGTGLGLGGSGGYGFPPSPASALDAACAAMLNGTTSLEGTAALESLLWSASSPGAGGGGPGSWSGRAGGNGVGGGVGGGGMGGGGAATLGQYGGVSAVTSGRGAGGGSTSAAATPASGGGGAVGGSSGGGAVAASVASGGPHCTPSSISDASEDCGVHGPPEIESTLDALLGLERPGSNGGLGLNLGLAEQWLSQQQGQGQAQQGQGQLFGAAGQGFGLASQGLVGSSPGSHHLLQQNFLGVTGSPSQAAYSSALGVAAAAYSTAAASRTLSGGSAASPPGPLQSSQGTFFAPSSNPGPAANAAANAASMSAAAAASAAVAAYTAAAAAAANTGTGAPQGGGVNGGSVNSAGQARPAPSKVMTGWAAVAAKGPGQGLAQGGRAGTPPTPQVGAAGGEAAGSAAAAAAAWRQAATGSGGAAFGAGGGSVGSAASYPAAAGRAAPPAAATPGQQHGSAAAAVVAFAAAGAGAGGGLVGSVEAKLMFPKTSQRLREDIMQLLRTVPGLKAEDFDEGVLYQLAQKRSEEEARAALRTLLGSDVSMLQHPAAYLNHVIKNFHLSGPGGVGQGADYGGGPSLPSATVRANSVPVSSKAILQRLPLRLYRRLEDIVSRCDHLEWKHFDAGVIKVMSQLAEISDDDVIEELELLQATDLSAVEYMPAYLNKRLNNRLWSKRKQQQAAHR